MTPVSGGGGGGGGLRGEVTCAGGNRHGKESALCTPICQIWNHINVFQSKHLNSQYRQQNYIISIHTLNYYWAKSKLNALFLLNIYLIQY